MQVKLMNETPKEKNVSWNKGLKGVQVAWNKGKKASVETRFRISLSKKGANHPNFGKNLSIETKRKISIANKNEKNGVWKGDNVGYVALHKWVIRNKPKVKYCETCGLEKKLDVANISGKYKRDISDFEYLCRRCHMNKDGRINNLKQFKG